MDPPVECNAWRAALPEPSLCLCWTDAPCRALVTWSPLHKRSCETTGSCSLVPKKKSGCGVVWCVWCVVWWWCGVVWCGVVWCGVVWCCVCGVVWCGVVWCGVVWCCVSDCVRVCVSCVFVRVCVVVLWCCGVVVLWCCGVVVLWSCGLVVLWSCGVVVLWCCGVWCCGVVVLLWCVRVVLCCCGVWCGGGGGWWLIVGCGWWVVGGGRVGGWVVKDKTFLHHRKATGSPTTRGPRTSSVATCGMLELREHSQMCTHRTVPSASAALSVSGHRSSRRFRLVLQATVNCLEFDFQKGKHFKFLVLSCTIFRHKDDSTGSCVHTAGHTMDGADDLEETEAFEEFQYTHRSYSLILDELLAKSSAIQIEICSMGPSATSMAISRTTDIFISSARNAFNIS